MSHLNNQLRYLDNLTMYLYDVEYVLSNGGMIWLLQGQRHLPYESLKLKKMAYFGEITGSHSLSIKHYSGGQIPVGIFSNTNIQYIVESYGGLVKLLV